MEKFVEYIDKANKELQIADHLIYITFSLIKDNKILLKALDSIAKSLHNTINAVLQYEYLYKRITLYKDGRSNFQTFSEKCMPHYSIDKAYSKEILEIFNIAEKHKKSPFEFSIRDKIIITTNGMQTEVITIDRIKHFLLIAKDTLKKASSGIITRF